MESLIILSQEDREIRRIVSFAIEHSAVQGVVLEIDAYWLTAWNYHKRYGDKGLDLIMHKIEEWFYSLSQFNHLLEEWLSDLPENLIPVVPIHPQDFDWKPKGWGWRAKTEGFLTDMSPIRIKICIKPESSTIPIIESNKYRVLYETRPIAFLSSNPRKYRRPIVGGLSIGTGPTDAGTVGGILKDNNNRNTKYGLTCAHVLDSGSVVDQPAQSDSFRAATIGNCLYDSGLVSSQAQGCTPYANNGINELDAAIFKIDSNTLADLKILDLGSPNGITPRQNVCQGQMVEFTGRTSGHRIVKVGGLGVVYELRHAGKKHCFKNIFELRWSRFYQLIARRPVAQGDSGAWVCNPDANGIGWCGMIIGEDRLQGYAIYAQTVEDWWKIQGLSLSVS